MIIYRIITYNTLTIKAAGYYDRISRPMDLGTMEKKVKEYQYQYVKEFLADIQQVYEEDIEL